MQAEPQIFEMMFLLLAIGAAGGFLSGLLGVGGGILFVPALFFCLTSIGLDEAHAMHVAVGSSLAIVLITGMTSAAAHYKRGGVDLERVKLWAAPMVVGVAGGAVFAGFVDSYILKLVFTAMTVLTAVYMIFSREVAVPTECRIVAVSVQKAVMGAIGIIAALVGVGGAIMTVPFMSWLGMPMNRASGTASALGLLISLPGAVVYMATGALHQDELPPYSIGYVNFIAMAMIIPSSILCAPLGVQAAHTLPRGMLRRVFAVVLIIVSARMLMSLR